MSLYQRLQANAEQQPDKTAIDSTVGEITYQQLKVLTDWCIEYFDSLGLVAGDRVAILALNHPDWFIATFAAARCGVVLVPLNWRLSSSELQFVIQDSEPKLLLHDDEFMHTALELQNASSALQLQRVGTSDFPVKGSASYQFTVDNKDSAADLFIVYTSGTTGRPKGAVLSQKAILCSAEMSQHMTDMTAQDNVLNVLPLFHVGGLNMANKNITLINSVPTLLQAMLNSAGWQPQKFNSLRAVSIGSTDVPVSLINRVQKAGFPLIQVYGATETGPVAIYQCIQDAGKVGTIGKAGSLCEIKLCNEEGKEVSQGESGEILVKGDNILTHYWRNRDASESNIKDGWFHTGDIAHVDSDGYYWFDDRLKHVVISGGENIYPAELERVIREVPGVAEVAVVGRSDERWGEVPVAVVAGEVEAQAVLDACETLARFKRPKDVIFVESLPRNALGKVQVHQVKVLID